MQSDAAHAQLLGDSTLFTFITATNINMTAPKPISEYMKDNETATYCKYDRTMIKDHREGKVEEAEKTARFLLDIAEIPLLIR